MSIKKLFIKEEEEEIVEQNNVHVSSQTPSFPKQSVSEPVVENSKHSGGSISSDDNIVNMIWDKIIEANRPGPDYLELKNNVEALEDLPISNEQKLMSAFKVLKKSYPNFKKDDITKAIDFYINVVNNERDAGLQQLETLKSSNIDATERDIQDMQNKAEALKRQYDELQTMIGTKTIELTQAKNEINMKYDSFVASVDAVINVLSNDKEKIMSINF